jgi:hypothetical protein
LASPANPGTLPLPGRCLRVFSPAPF